MIIHICAPQPTIKELVKRECPDCHRRSYFTAFFTPWYGWELTCLNCGRNFGCNEWLPLPFVRQARQKSITAAKRRWRNTIIPPEVDDVA